MTENVNFPLRSKANLHSDTDKNTSNSNLCKVKRHLNKNLAAYLLDLTDGGGQLVNGLQCVNILTRQVR